MEEYCSSDPAVSENISQTKSPVDTGSSIANCARCRTSLSLAAHELKTPLVALEGYTEMLRSGAPGPLTAKQEEILGRLDETRQELLRHIRQFLTYGAARYDEVALELVQGDLVECLAELVQFWAPRFEQKNISFEFVVENMNPFSFDYHKVQHIVSNLLENGFIYCVAGCKLQLRAKPYFWDRRLRPAVFPFDRRTSTERSPNSALIVVADTGSGIAPEFQQQIFDEFFRGPRAGKPVEGAGLGLAIAKRLTYAHGGKIWVESSPGAGSTFAVLLPFASDTDKPSEARRK